MRDVHVKMGFVAAIGFGAAIICIVAFVTGKPTLWALLGLDKQETSPIPPVQQVVNNYNTFSTNPTATREIIIRQSNSPSFTASPTEHRAPPVGAPPTTEQKSRAGAKTNSASVMNDLDGQQSTGKRKKSSSAMEDLDGGGRPTSKTDPSVMGDLGGGN